VLLPLIGGGLVLYNYRRQLLGPEWDTTVRILTAAALLSLSWELARNIGRAFGPQLFQRLDPSTAGTVGFLIRLFTILAAQQTLGNLLAGTVLLSARPFRVGERVRLQSGSLAGTIDGVVSSLGILYTTLARGDDAIMVPNSVVLSSAIVPLREPAGVDMRTRLRPGVTPVDVEEHLRGAIATPIRSGPRITLEEVDGDQVVVRIEATPRDPADGPRLAAEVLASIASLTSPPATLTDRA
jgi:hypothetical protein